jgi:hypothetical protein
MVNPEKYSNNYKADDIYTCPDQTRGSHFSGPARVSLVDNNSNRIINTIEIRQEYNEGLDTFDIPFAIRKGYYYKTNGKSEKWKEIKPQIMWLKDYNGDGKTLEFVLFDAISCMGLETTLIGYSPFQDKVVQYPIKLEIYDKEQYVQESHWADYLFGKKPLKPGYWKYEVDYRGRGGFLCKYEVHYNKKTDTFEGKLIYQH